MTDQISPSSANATAVALPRIMGVLNLTPDSFSDGGKFFSAEAAIAQAKQLISEGASVIDVGGESTRPGATRLTPAEEQERVLDVIADIAQLPEVASGSVQISVDTLNSSTALLAVAAGATIVNDVSGGQADPAMFATVAQLNSAGKPVTYVLGHWANFAEGSGAVQQTSDILGSVVAELSAAVAVAESAGFDRAALVLDPGLGFGKDSDQNWQLVHGFDALASLGLPVLIGASRKRFIAAQVAQDQGVDVAQVTIEQRDAATAALSAEAWAKALEHKTADKLWGFRVHNVRANIDALQAAAALRFAH